MENRIKEQYSLFAGRVSATILRADQLRIYLSAATYVLMSAFRRLALFGTAWAGRNPRHSAAVAPDRFAGANHSPQGLDCACPLG